MRKKRLFTRLVSTTLFSLSLLSIDVHGENAKDDTDLFSLTLEELLTIKVISATKQSQSISDAPSIINVITASEIAQMGASNLTDILRIIPGFTPTQATKE